MERARSISTGIILSVLVLQRAFLDHDVGFFCVHLLDFQMVDNQQQYNLESGCQASKPIIQVACYESRLAHSK
jgi:hypothetical protein